MAPRDAARAAAAMIDYARAATRRGAREDARAVLEHAPTQLGDARAAIARARLALARVVGDRDDVDAACDAATRAVEDAGAMDDDDGAAARAAATTTRARRARDAWMDVVADARATGEASARCAVTGGVALAALTRHRGREARDAAETCAIALRETTVERLREAKDAPHAWAIASAMKTLGHVEMLTANGSKARAMEMYERAREYAADAARSERDEAATSRFVAEDLGVDCALAMAQACAAMGDADNAEAYAARAVSGAEALGDERHPRVGAAIAVSGDAYVAKALRSMSNDAKTSLGDGAGVMFAEGLYKSAIKLMHYPHIVEDGSVVRDAESRRLCALLHARYSSVLRASGSQRAREADAWLESAKILWPDERGADEGANGVEIVTATATKLGVEHGPAVLIDLQQMAPLTMGGA